MIVPTGVERPDPVIVTGRGPIRLGIVDDHWMLRDGLRAWIAVADTGIQVVVSVAAWAELLASPAFPVDVVLLDLDLGDFIPPPVKIVQLRSAGVATVVISGYADPAEVRACIAAGASAYLPKSDPVEEIAAAVTLAAAGGSYESPSLAELLVNDRQQSTEAGAIPKLSEQETRVLVLYASNLPMKRVARQMNVAEETAKSYLKRVKEKYAEAGREASTKIDLHRRAVEDGYLNHRDP